MRPTSVFLTWATLTLSGSVCAQEAQEASAQAEGAAPAKAAQAEAPPSAPTLDGAEDKATADGSAETKERTTASEQARQLGHAGLSAYGNKEFATALDQFQQAEALAHSPVFQLYVARCLLQLGRADEARPLLTAIAVEEQPTGVPDAWKRARADAADELSSLDSTRNAHDVATPRVEPEALDLPASTQSATAGSPPSGTSSTQPALYTATSSDSAKHRLHRYQWGAIAAYSAGGAGLVFGSVFGGLAIARAGNVKENCDGASCLPEDQPTAHEAVRFGNLATAGFVAAAVGAVAGTTLLLLPRDRGRKSMWSFRYEGTAVRLMHRF